jgi:hypothetical protein
MRTASWRASGAVLKRTDPSNEEAIYGCRPAARFTVDKHMPGKSEQVWSVDNFRSIVLPRIASYDERFIKAKPASLSLVDSMKRVVCGKGMQHPVRHELKAAV